ncbi:MAG: TrlF family AAA-like ATPase [candidate division WOR-3 bacterium]
MALKCYPKGSEWRKWDLHVHTKSDQGYTFSSNSEVSGREQSDNEYPRVFIEHIYAIDNLGAIAITNHNKADWIDKIIKENENYCQQNRRNKITIFPGVEIESSDGIHLLVIFNPETQIDEVKSNFRKQTWEDTIEHFITATKNLSNPNALKTTEEILEEAEKWDALCIFPHVTNDKGFFKISSGDRKTKIYKHRLTQIFQIPVSGKSDQRYENIVHGKDPNYGNKSITLITSSDAKKLEDIGRNNLWIKADPTFEGLKQIIYEPDERVYIGEEPPRKIERNKIITSLTISKSNRWFNDNYIIPINEEMVSVIGGKGTGKTAILDLIAYATRSYKCYEKDEIKSKSFLKRAYRELKGTNVKVEWDNGNVDEITIGDKLEEATETKVRYLPQDFIDQLCSELGKNEIEEQIENVIFQKIPEEDKSGFANFKDYKNAQLRVINENKNRTKVEIEQINSKIYELNELIKTKSNKLEELKKIESEIIKFEQEKNKVEESLTISNEQRNLKTLSFLNEKKSKLETEISTMNNELRKIEEIRNKINNFEEDAKKFTQEIKDELQTAGITQKHIEQIKVILYPENIKEILSLGENEINMEIRDKKNNLSNILNEINELNKKIKIEKSKLDKINEINKLLSDLKKKKEAINSDIKKIEEAEKILPDLMNQRENFFIHYFELIFEEKEKLRQIYSPLESFLKESGEEQEKRENNERLFAFTVKFNFDTESMAREGDKLIDHTIEGRFRRKEWRVLHEEIEELEFSLNLENNTISEQDKENIKIFVESVKNLFSKDEKEKQYEIANQLRSEYNEQYFFDWLYSTKYYSINYSIKFNGIDLANLSPGLKGVALLILFLELDEEDKRPILIDQPEENLDNRSVYNTLVKYFRKAKKRRQVIIVTHNPNLVVNTDSEQIIVANFDKTATTQPSKIFYVSGSLENTFKDDDVSNLLEKQGIREHICEILEGGKVAFEKREKKYGF